MTWEAAGEANAHISLPVVNFSTATARTLNKEGACRVGNPLIAFVTEIVQLSDIVTFATALIIGYDIIKDSF